MTTHENDVIHEEVMDLINNSYADESDLVALLEPYVEARRVKANTETFLSALGERFKAWLEEHPDDELVDGEHNLRAFMQTRKGSASYDLITIHEADPVLFERLLKTGCLSVNAAAVKAQGVQVAGVEKYASPAASTTALQVKEIK